MVPGEVAPAEGEGVWPVEEDVEDAAGVTITAAPGIGILPALTTPRMTPLVARLVCAGAD
jgi:hypothetical protein